MLKLGKHELPTPAICGSVISEDLDAMSTGVDRALEQGADLVELRLDKLRDSEGWQRLLREDLPMIVTNRAEREGGHFKGEESERIGPLLGAIGQGVACVDLELSTPKGQLDEVLEAAKKSGTSVLISHHDFEGVPPVEELIEIARRMTEAGCDIAKLVGFAEHPRDALGMLDFIVRAPDAVDVPVVAFAMGEAGKFSRVIAPFFGSPLVYAAVDEAAAPGQLDVATMRGLLGGVKGSE